MKLDLSLANLITKSARVITRHYQREVARYNITASQGGLIYFLNIIGPSTQVELARILHLDKTNVNAMVKKLEAAGLIAVRKDSDDTRKSRVALSAKGAALAIKLNEVDVNVAEFYKKLAGGEKNAAIIKEFLGKIVFEE